MRRMDLHLLAGEERRVAVGVVLQPVDSWAVAVRSYSSIHPVYHVLEHGFEHPIDELACFQGGYVADDSPQRLLWP